MILTILARYIHHSSGHWELSYISTVTTHNYVNSSVSVYIRTYMKTVVAITSIFAVILTVRKSVAIYLYT